MNEKKERLAMTGEELRGVRKEKGWTQVEVAKKLGVTQGYLSMLEGGVRALPNGLARRAAELLDAPATTLPLRTVKSLLGNGSEQVRAGLANLGYPAFGHMKKGGRRNPAEIALQALNEANLDSRVVEGLPWLLARYADMDWDWLIQNAKFGDRQNRLGFLTSVALERAQAFKEKYGLESQRKMKEYLSVLERSRLAGEDTLCHDSLTPPEREWLRSNRPEAAKHWNLLTDLRAEQLPYVEF